MNKIMFTGGGSAGHVTVNLALIPHFVEAGWSVDYIGSENGIEKQLVSSLSNVNYFEISTGKLRRYFDWQNVKDPFKVVKGVFQAYRHIKDLKPNVLFSKGGFVSVPVVLGAWLNKVPVIIHESDITPGLANRISIPFATKICTTFPETAKHLQTGKTEYVGAVIREELKHGNADKGRAFCRFTENKPVLLIMGGSLGSRRINETVRRALDKLTETFQVVHLCGKGQLDSSIQNDNYRQYEFINEQLPDILEMSDVIISRAGSNSIFEFLYLRKPMLLIPLTKEQSRGDQILNARSFEALGFCEVLYEENLTEETLLNQAAQLYEHRLTYVRKMTDYEQRDALNAVIQLIEQAAKAN